MTPALLTHSGPNVAYATYGLLPGATGDYFDTPDRAGLNLGETFEIIARLSMVDWTPAAKGIILAKDASGSRSFEFFGDLDNTLHATIFNQAGSLAFNTGSSAGAGFTNDTIHWVRMTADLDNGSGATAVDFSTADDAASPPASGTFAALGTQITNAVTGTSVFDSTAPLEIGRRVISDDFYLNGKVYRVLLYNGLRDSGGTLVADFDPRLALPGDSKFVDACGNTWTKHGNAAFT